MTKEEKPSNLSRLLREIDLKPETYSGKGMNGKECVAVQVEDTHALWRMILETGLNLAENYDDEERYDLSAEVRSAFKRMCIDDLGRNIIAYFPGIPYVED